MAKNKYVFIKFVNNISITKPNNEVIEALIYGFRYWVSLNFLNISTINFNIDASNKNKPGNPNSYKINI